MTKFLQDIQLFLEKEVLSRINIFFILSHFFMAALVLFKSPFEFYFGYLTYLTLPVLLARYGLPVLEL